MKTILVSTVNPGDIYTMARRVVLHYGMIRTDELVVHYQNVEDGSMDTGSYFEFHSWRDALDEFVNRCRKLGVRPTFASKTYIAGEAL